MESLEGHLLAAVPQLQDPNFVRTVLLMVQHNDEGAFGLILNRPVSKTVQELWREVGSAPCHCRQPIFLGGPVPGPLMALHEKPNLAEVELLPGLYFSAQRAHLDALVLEDSPTCKIFVGHSGWGPGQLENELNEGAWRSMKASSEYVFQHLESLWETVLRDIGHATLQSILHLKDIPPDPGVN